MNSHDIERFQDKVDIKGPNDCWEWKATISHGYGNFSIYSKMKTAHRVAWEIVNGPIPEDKMILHSCDNPLCVNPNHLRLGTNKDNMHDRAFRYKGPYKGNQPKLRDEDILTIKKMWNENRGTILQSQIAEKFKVDKSTISRIVNNEGRYR